MGLATDLISYWKMDDSSGDIDDAKSTNDGTYNGALYSQTGKINDSIGFDGSNDTVTFGTHFGLGGTTGITFNAWINFDAVNKYQGFLSTSTNLTFMAQTDGSLFMYIAGTGKTTAASVVSTGSFQMCTFTYDGTNMKIYHNAVLKATEANTSNIPSENMLLGNDRAISGRWFGGDMDEVGIWSAALTSTEITSLYNSRSGWAYPFTSEPEAAPLKVFDVRFG